MKASCGFWFVRGGAASGEKSPVGLVCATLGFVALHRRCAASPASSALPSCAHPAPFGAIFLVGGPCLVLGVGGQVMGVVAPAWFLVLGDK